MLTEYLKYPFKYGAKGNRVTVTTRENVALAMYSTITYRID